MNGQEMENVFPEPIRSLPQAAIPLKGVRAYLSQADCHQILFMEFSEDEDLPEHTHAAQVGIVLEGQIDLEIGGERTSFTKGDRYYIPGGLKHSGRIHAGYADVTFFAEPNRYSVKDEAGNIQDLHPGHSGPLRMAGQNRFLKLLLRIIGTASLFAVAGIVVPYAWMDAIHGRLGMGRLPSDPIVGYLARSTSAFYALLGGLLWVVSFDPRGHRLVLQYLGGAIVVFGAALLAVDLLEGMPVFWSLCEGPVDIALGTVILWLSLHSRPRVRR